MFLRSKIEEELFLATAFLYHLAVTINFLTDFIVGGVGNTPATPAVQGWRGRGDAKSWVCHSGNEKNKLLFKKCSLK